MPLKYLTNFWKSLEMPLINFKVELKLRWAKHCYLAPVSVENNNADSSNIILKSKTQDYMFLWSNYQQKTIKNYQKY